MSSRVRAYPEFFIFILIALFILPFLGHLNALPPFPASLLVFALFMLPGAAVVVLMGNRDSWPERVVFAFIASLAVCGIPAQAAIFLHTNLGVYVVLFGILTVGLVGAALLVAWRRTLPTGQSAEQDHVALWLLVLLGLVMGALILFWLNSPMDGDQWDNLGWAQSLINDAHIFVLEPRFAATPVSPRFFFSAWLMQQAAMSVLSGVNLVDLVSPLTVPMILLSLAAVYTLARRISGNKNAAVLMTIVWGLYLLIWNEGTVAGYEIIVRASLDKVIGGFIIVPLGIAFALDYFNKPQPRS